MTDTTTPTDRLADVSHGTGKSTRVLALLGEQRDDRAHEQWIDPMGVDHATDGGER